MEISQKISLVSLEQGEQKFVDQLSSVDDDSNQIVNNSCNHTKKKS